MNLYNLANTFFGAGLSSALIYVLALEVSPLIAAIIWTIPFTMIFPIINFHRVKKSKKFIAKYLKTQSYTMILLLVFLYTNAYFIENSSIQDGIYVPLLKGCGVWAISAVIYYFIYKKFKNYFIKSDHVH